MRTVIPEVSGPFLFQFGHDIYIYPTVSEVPSFLKIPGHTFVVV